MSYWNMKTIPILSQFPYSLKPCLSEDKDLFILHTTTTAIEEVTWLSYV